MIWKGNHLCFVGKKYMYVASEALHSRRKFNLDEVSDASQDIQHRRKAL